ncbi:MAG TPA: FxLYD domain-containing protein [Bacilli bacterium]|nr:FxLYD domain-containing protein [Bacilli bacterium]
MKKVKTLDKNIEDNDIEKKKFSFKNIEAKYYIIAGAIVAAIIVVIVLLASGVFKQENTSAIVESSPTYQGKTITVIDGNTVIEEDNDSKTIEETTTASSFIQTSDEIQSQYSFSDISVSKSGINTIVKGNVTNNSSKYKNAYVNVKFYDNSNAIGSTSVLVKDLKKGSTQSFELKIVGDYTNKEYVSKVEYVS